MVQAGAAENLKGSAADSVAYLFLKADMDCVTNEMVGEPSVGRRNLWIWCGCA
jgi:hypothetical protein